MVINGHLTDLIKSKQGLRQGDLLSPCLYKICAEALRMVNALASRKPALFPTIAPGGERLPIFQADDTLLFIRASRKAATNIQKILRNYAVEAGQCANFLKSSLTFSSNTDKASINLVKGELGITSVNESFSYLGKAIGIKSQRHRTARTPLSTIKENRPLERKSTAFGRAQDIGAIGLDGNSPILERFPRPLT